MNKKISEHIKIKQNLHDNFNMKIIGQRLFLGDKTDTEGKLPKREKRINQLVTNDDFKRIKQLDIKDSHSRGLKLSCIKKDYFFIFEKRMD